MAFNFLRLRTKFYRKEFTPTGANSFLPELTPIEKGRGAKKENSRVTSPTYTP